MSVRVRNTKPPTQQQLEEHAKEEQRRLNIVTECLAKFKLSKAEKVEKKKPIPFIIESDSEEESDDEGEFTCYECGCDGMYAPDDTCSKCLIEMCRKR
jgi:hypothetical protein